MKFLWVCTGNMYRSRSAWAFASQLSGLEHEHQSAGTSDLAGEGHIPPRKLRETLSRSFGLAPKWPPSQKVNRALLDWADVVVVMQPSHVKDVAAIGGCGTEPGRLMSLAEFSPFHRTRVPDPAFMSDPTEFLGTIIKIRCAVENVLRTFRAMPTS